MKKQLIYLFFAINSVAFSQKDNLKLGDSYAEDQIYAAISYSKLFNQPNNTTGSGFSYSFSTGFLKDFTLNKSGSFSIALGAGYGFDALHHGFKITEITNNTVFEIDVPTAATEPNNLKTHSLELPFEIRWRTSNATKYKFWRVYTGIKFTYNFINTFHYNTTSFVNVNRFNKWQYGITLSTGYDAFNIQVYYGLTPILKDASVGVNTINTQIVKFGFVFYIL